MTPFFQHHPASRSPRLLFACYHFYLDPSNGAAITTREILLALAARGWEIRTLCGCGLDFQKPERIMQIISDRGMKLDIHVQNKGSVPFTFSHFCDGLIKSSLFLPEENKLVPSEDVGFCFLRLLYEMFEQFQPNILLTYGGFWMLSPLLQMAKKRNVKTVFSLRNFAYKTGDFFHDVDLTLVPSQFSADYYAEKLGIISTPIPSLIDWKTVLCKPEQSSKKYVTFVNPDPDKGVFVFAQIALQIWKRRPDIPLLVVEGRCGVDWLGKTGVDLRGVKNLNLMANTPDPRDFYRVTKIMLVPSLFMESFGRVASEAMINGIPVIGSNRGALPEVIGEAGLTLEIPGQYTPETRIAPTPEEVELWVQAIISLWDDREFYKDLSVKSQARAERWRPEIIADMYDSALTALVER